MEAFDIFPCCYDDVILAPSSELHYTPAFTAKKLVTDQQTARSSSTDPTTNYP